MDTLKTIFKSIGKWLLSACLMNLILLALMLFAFRSCILELFESERAPLKPDSILLVDTSMRLSDIALDSRWDIVVQDYAKMSLLELYEKISSAAEDPNIKSIMLVNTKSQFNFNLSQSLAIKKALSDFKKSGKKVYCYLGNTNVDEKEYFLASMADEIWMNPQSTLSFSGIAFEGLFFGNAFEKYGIGVNVIRCGSNKSFGDMFTRSSFAPQQKADLEEIAKSFYDFLLGAAAKNRGNSLEDIMEIAQAKPIMNPKNALEYNLIDKIYYRDEVDTFFAQAKDSFNKVFAQDYAPVYRLNKKKAKENIAVVYMTGTIVEFGNNDGNVIAASRYCEIIEKIRKDKSIKSVVFVINSGGGSAYASEQLRRSVDILSKEKKTIAYVTSMCASGAYWIATACDDIYTQETSLLGSIGVFSLLFDVEKISADFGVTYDAAKSGKFADIMNGKRKPSEEEITLIQEQVNLIYDDFITLVANSRDLDPTVVRNEIATGSLWTSQKAKALGLIDSDDNNLPDTLRALAKELNLSSDYGVLTYPSPKTYEDLINEFFTGESSISIDVFTPKILKEQINLDDILSTFKDSNNMYLRTPLYLKDL